MLPAPVDRAEAFLIEAGHQPLQAQAMALNTLGNDMKVPQEVRRQLHRYRDLRMTPQERSVFAERLLARRVIAEGMLMTLAGSDVRDGAVLAAHKLCEARTMSKRSLSLPIGGARAPFDQARAAYDRVQAEIAELDALIEAAVKSPDTLSQAKAGAKPNPRVVHLQNRLNSIGHRVLPDGVFGPITAEAVKDFQTNAGLTVTGDVDTLTADSLRRGGRPSWTVDAPPGVVPGQAAPAPQGAGTGNPNKETGNDVTRAAPDTEAPAEKDEPEKTEKKKSGKRRLSVHVDLGEGKRATCVKCGAPVRKDGKACQRGHRVPTTMQEAWSQAARDAAALARKEKHQAALPEGLRWNDRKRSLEGKYHGVPLERGVAYQGKLATGDVFTGHWTGEKDANDGEPVFKHVDTGDRRTFRRGKFFGKLSDVKPGTMQEAWSDAARRAALAAREGAARADLDFRVKDFFASTPAATRSNAADAPFIASKAVVPVEHLHDMHRRGLLKRQVENGLNNAPVFGMAGVEGSDAGWKAGERAFGAPEKPYVRPANPDAEAGWLFTPQGGKGAKRVRDVEDHPLREDWAKWNAEHAAHGAYSPHKGFDIDALRQNTPQHIDVNPRAELAGRVRSVNVWTPGNQHSSATVALADNGKKWEVQDSDGFPMSTHDKPEDALSAALRHADKARGQYSREVHEKVGGPITGLRESAQTAELSTTHAPIGKGGKNWVTETKPGNSGQLPAYIQNIRNALIRDGKDESHATAIAISTVKRWAAGGGGVHPEVRAAAAKAVAEWEKLKATSHARSAAKDVSEAQPVRCGTCGAPVRGRTCQRGHRSLVA